MSKQVEHITCHKKKLILCRVMIPAKQRAILSAARLLQALRPNVAACPFRLKSQSSAVDLAFTLSCLLSFQKQWWKDRKKAWYVHSLTYMLSGVFAVHPHMHASQGASTCHPGTQQHRQDHVWQGNLCNWSCTYSQVMQPTFTTTSQEKSAHGQLNISVFVFLLATHTDLMIGEWATWFVMYFKWLLISALASSMLFSLKCSSESATFFRNHLLRAKQVWRFTE